MHDTTNDIQYKIKLFIWCCIPWFFGCLNRYILWLHC